MYILAQSAPSPTLNCRTLCTTRPTGKCLIRNGQNTPTLISISVTSVTSLMNSLKNSPSSQWHRGQVFALWSSSRPICVPLWSILEGQPCLLSPDGLWADSVPDLHTINNKSRRRVSLCAGYRLFHTIPNGQKPQCVFESVHASKGVYLSLTLSSGSPMQVWAVSCDSESTKRNNWARQTMDTTTKTSIAYGNSTWHASKYT